jgi:hypothetical protein
MMKFHAASTKILTTEDTEKITEITENNYRDHKSLFPIPP